MSADSSVRPEPDSWVAAIHASESDFAPLGTAVVIDQRRLLTCAHVVINGNDVRDSLWVAFPKVDEATGQRRRVASVVMPNRDREVADLAVLILADPVPAGVTAAPLKCPRPSDLAERRWWAFGFGHEDPLGNSAAGLIGAPLAYGWVRVDAESRYHVKPGFSGAGLWSPDYQAVVGVVGQANERGDGRAITMYQADLCFPAEDLRLLADWSALEAGELALAAWGWTLDKDPETARHWRPRARGVNADSERGHRFRGRSVALSEITGWLDRDLVDRRVLVVTGSPGTGKSAVLGRIVTTADPASAAELPDFDRAIRASPGSVACAVHAKGKTALEVAAEVARAASARLPGHVEDFAPAMRAALAGRTHRRFNVIIDALDEAADPDQARTIVTKIVLPLTETCSDLGAQVVVGSRHRDEDGDLLATFGRSMAVIDLDDPRFFSDQDLAAYVMATLQLVGDEREDSPYADDSVANAVARRIAELSDRNFLVAGLTARAHGLHDQYAADPAELSFTATVDAAMRGYLQRLSPAADVPAEIVLTALAFAEAPGLSLQLWQTAVRALGARNVSTRQLASFARSTAASFLVESGGDGQITLFRLFHQALNDALLRARSQIVALDDDERAIARAFVAVGSERGWSEAPAYLLHSLPYHAARTGMIDELLADDAYLLHADLSRLIPLTNHASSSTGRERAQLLRLTPRAISADPSARTAMFSVTETLENLGRRYTTSHFPAPYRAKWATAPHRKEWFILEGHTNWVNALCAFTQNGRYLLASGSSDLTVRIWDPAIGTELDVLHGHTDPVLAICSLTHEHRTLLATSGFEDMVRIWDPATSTEHAVLHADTWLVEAVCAFGQEGRILLASSGGIWDVSESIEYALLHAKMGAVSALCSFSQEDRTLLAAGYRDTTVRIWDPAAGTELAVLHGHTGWVTGVCAFIQDGRTLLASSGEQTVRIWDPAAGTQLAVLQHAAWIRAVCTFTLDGRTLLASGSDDRTVRIWDPATGVELGVLHGHTDAVRAVCAIAQNGSVLLASASEDSTVRIWNSRTAIEHTALRGTSNMINALCSLTLDDRPLLAGGSWDGTLRVWDADTGTEFAVLHHTGCIRAVSTFTLGGRTLVASGSGSDDDDDRTVRIWDPDTGTELAVLYGHVGAVITVCAFIQDGRTLLASGSDDRTVRIWDPDTGAELAVLQGHTLSVNALCAFTSDGRTLLASGSDDRTVRIWDPDTGTELAVLHGHVDRVLAICAFTQDSRTLLASGGGYDDDDDRTVRIWDPDTGTELAVLRGHAGAVISVCAFIQDGRTLLASGSDDRTVRIWDPATATALLTVPVHHPVLAIDYISSSLVILITGGLLAIQLSHLP